MVSGNSFVADRDHQEELVAATTGDRIALQQLLVEHTSDITQYVTDRLPSRFKD